MLIPNRYIVLLKPMSIISQPKATVNSSRGHTTNWDNISNLFTPVQAISNQGTDNCTWESKRIIRETQIKTSVRCHRAPVRVAILKKTTNSKRWWGCKEKGTLVRCQWECRLVQRYEYGVCFKNRTIWFSSPIPRYLAKVKWSEVTQSCPTLCDPMDCSLPGSSVLGIFQAMVLEWIAITFSRGASRPRDQTQVSHIVDRRFTAWATREVPI